jgi:hypothetical protein
MNEKKPVSNEMTCAADQTFDKLLVSCIISISNVSFQNDP